MIPQLTIGPIFFHWPAEQKRDFYFRIADEAPVETVYIGETICSKRTPFFEQYYDEVAERLQNAAKKVIYSTLSEVMIRRDRQIVEGFCELEDAEIEANDASALWYLAGKKHRIGQFMNVYNEDTMAFLAGKGAHHFCLPPELPKEAIAVLGKADIDVSLEIQVFGRVSLALSARCYHARAHGRIKDNCQFVCEEDPDGMDLRTLEGKPFLSINGIQTLSYTFLNLIHELETLQGMNISHFRLSPHTYDMIAIADIFQSVLDKRISSEEAQEKLNALKISAPYSNGFFHKKPGYAWVSRERD
ncbi:MAG: U32 family peptidase [Alphaproteobacteria bacterium PRO2]|jgi:collagenase-like PrtC family protease|nr:U32 family peptidase [Alphaproteobacteria bacterium PRO2]